MQVHSAEFSRFLRDANAFVASSREAIERSAPHIYLSALPFAAKGSLIHTSLSSLITGVVSVETIGIDPHGQRLAMTLTGHQNMVVSVAYTPDGSLVSGSHDGTVRIWDTRTGEESISLFCGGNEGVQCVAVAPTGTSLAAATVGGTLCIWNLQALRRPPLRLSGHSMTIYSIAFSPDGQLIASASRDNSLRIWIVATGQQTAVLTGHADGFLTVTFSPDGNFVASGSLDRTLRLWNNTTGQPAEMYVVEQKNGRLQCLLLSGWC